MTSTRHRLLSATNEMFRRHGYHGTSLKQVTTAAGAPTGSLYHFFPGGKQDLAEAAIDASGAAYRELFELIADAAADPAAAVVDFFDGAADVLEQSDYIDPCPIGTVAREVASTDEALRQAAERVFASWIDAAATRFEAAGLARRDARDLAATVVAALEGSFVLARTRRDTAALRATGRHLRHLVEGAMAGAPVR
jgi:AcrR family transcriptional regulator